VSRVELDLGNRSALKAQPKEWIALAVLSLPCAVYAMDRTVLNLALPRISAELKPTSAQLLWIVDIYVFVLAGLLITMGALGDRIGRRRLLLVGALAFAAASVLAALSTTAPMLITARALLGIGGAALAPSTLSLIRHLFLDPGQRTFAIGIWAASHSVGGALGPLIGGVLLQSFGWASVFWIGVPVMALLLMLGPLLLPEFRSSRGARMDFFSAGQSLGAVLLLVHGFKEIAAQGWQLSAAISIALGIGVGIAFIRRQRRTEVRLVDLSILRAPTFAVALFAYTLGCFVASGIALFIAQYLQLVLGFEPFKAALYTLPSTVGFAVGSTLVPMIARLMAPAQTMSAGSLLAATGLWLIMQIDEDSGSGIFLVGLFAFSLGLASVFIQAIALMVSSVPPDRVGEASAVSETGSEFGAALGMAALGSIGTAVYSGSIAGAMPSGLAPEAMQVARDTLGGAVELAHQLPGEVRELLLHAARAAFDNSFHIVVSLGAVITIVIAITAQVMTRLQSPGR